VTSAVFPWNSIVASRASRAETSGRPEVLALEKTVEKRESPKI
jgi:hypothetical protein